MFRPPSSAEHDRQIRGPSIEGRAPWHVCLALTALALCLPACAAPRFALREAPPTLPSSPQSLRSPPSPPTGEIEIDLATAITSKTTASRAVPDLTATVIAVAPATGESAAAFQAAFDERIQKIALNSRIAGLVNLNPLRNVAVEGKRVETRGNVREEVTWTGSLERLASLVRVSRATHLLQLDVKQFRTVTEQVKANVKFRPGAIDAYGVALNAYLKQRHAYTAALRRAEGGFSARFLQAQSEYNREGGLYGPNTSEGREASAIVQRFQAWQSILALRQRALGTARSLPPADEESLRKLALRKKAPNGQTSVKIARLQLQTRLLDVATGETFWMDDLLASGGTTEAVVQACIARLVADLRKPAVAATAGVSGQ